MNFCKCCRKKKHKKELAEFKLPIICIRENNGTMEQKMIPVEMELCTVCAQRIMVEYYKIAEENNFSGLKAVME